MKRLKGIIINASLSNITDKKTGEVNELTKITYALERENTDRFIGSAILECYKFGNCFETIKRNMLVPVTLEIDEKLTSNGSKYSINSINGKEL